MKETCPEEQFIWLFDRKIQRAVYLNFLFLAMVIAEAVLFVLFLPYFMKNAFISFMIAAFVLTVFGYFILRQYLESQKNSYFETMLEDFINETQIKNPHEIAKISTRLAHRLYQREYKYYTLPRALSFLNGFSEKAGAVFHWRDVHLMRELLLQKAVHEQMEVVRKEPTNPDAHALLANAYVMLSGLYINPKNIENENPGRWAPENKYGPEMEALFEETAKHAVEEFKILKEYAPNDPWIYMQLAYSYRDLGMHEEEKEAYKSILMLRPHDHETRYNLARLYFKRGENAHGLKIFEELKKANYSKADELLCIYGQRKAYG